MKPITDIRKARHLPEREAYDIVEELQPDGHTMMRPIFREMVAVELDDNAIIMFVDVDGRPTTVDYDSQGAYKREMR